ncbi:MAG: hypothetical protein U0792_20680 [Gemmataceae bacterium]
MQLRDSFARGIANASDAAARQGLRAEHRGKSFASWCQFIVDIAEEGLRQSENPEQSRFLAPLREVLAAVVHPGWLAHERNRSRCARGLRVACE